MSHVVQHVTLALPRIATCIVDSLSAATPVPPRLQPEFTKPNNKKHRINPGGVVKILAGISGDRVVLWHDLGKKWNGKVAAEMYHGPIIKVLRRVRGVKPSYLVCEDNDPSGYKSGLGKTAKRELKIKTVPWPRYSPDLMPLDFSLWRNTKLRIDKTDPKGRETAEAYKKRLRKTALATPRAAVRKMVASIRRKAKEIWDAKGGSISSD